MKNTIIEFLNEADERKMNLIYSYAKALVGKDAGKIPVSSTNEELEQAQAICRNIRERGARA